MGGVPDRLEVFADVSCPFAHVSLLRFVAERERRGRSTPVLQVRAWPLELVNGEPLTGAALAEKVEALRSSVAPDRFAGFSPTSFPLTTLPVLAAEAAAHVLDPGVGERFSLRARSVLFDEGLDPSQPDVLRQLLAEHGVDPAEVRLDAVSAAWAEGRRRGVIGSPTFFVGGQRWFCPALAIGHDDAGYHVEVDVSGVTAFLDAVFAERSSVATPPPSGGEP